MIVAAALCLWVSYCSFNQLITANDSSSGFLNAVDNKLHDWSTHLEKLQNDLRADIARQEAAKSTESANFEESAQGNVHWDQNRVLQNAQFDYATNEMHVCARDAATIALRAGVRNRENIGSTVTSLCKAQLALFFMGAKAKGIPSQEQTELAKSLIDSEIEAMLQLGR